MGVFAKEQRGGGGRKELFYSSLKNRTRNHQQDSCEGLWCRFYTGQQARITTNWQVRGEMVPTTVLRIVLGCQFLVVLRKSALTHFK